MFILKKWDFQFCNKSKNFRDCPQKKWKSWKSSILGGIGKHMKSLQELYLNFSQRNRILIWNKFTLADYNMPLLIDQKYLISTIIGLSLFFAPPNGIIIFVTIQHSWYFLPRPPRLFVGIDLGLFKVWCIWKKKYE